jgi:hypothetical protein
MSAQKEAMAHGVESKEKEEESRVEDAPSATAYVPSDQKVTKQMIFFSAYIALAGWIFNFDLGKYFLQDHIDQFRFQEEKKKKKKKGDIQTNSSLLQALAGRFCKWPRTKSHSGTARPKPMPRQASRPLCARRRRSSKA